MTKKEVTCINCPLGCQMVVLLENGCVSRVEGNSCPRGEKYAMQEVTSPTRTITSTVKLVGGKKERVSVKTLPEVPKDKIFSVMEVIHNTVATYPVRIGDVLIKEIAGTSSSLVVTSEG